MPSVDSSMRLMPGLDPEYEWKYLINETLLGERCIIPLLLDLRNSPYIGKNLAKAIEKQIDEESEHVKAYEAFVGSDRLVGSQYEIEFSKLVSSIQSVTLRLFAIQGMLESIALGALNYRLKFWNKSPSAKVDKKVLREEASHVGISFDHFKSLGVAEGFNDRKKFREIARGVNSIFRSHFSELSLSKIAVNDFGRVINVEEVNLYALNSFRVMSRDIVSSVSSRFINKYLMALKS